MKRQRTLRELVTDAVRDAPRQLGAIYRIVRALRPGTAEETIRARIYEEMDRGRILRIAEGIYLAADGPARLLLVEGDAWHVLEQLPDDVLDGFFSDVAFELGTLQHLGRGTTRRTGDGPARSYQQRDLDEPFLRHLFRVLKKDKEWRTEQAAQRPRGGAVAAILTPPRTRDTWRHIQALVELAESCGFEYQGDLPVDYEDRGMGYWPAPQQHWLWQIFTAGPRAGLPFDLKRTTVVRVKRLRRAAHGDEHEAEKPPELMLDIVQRYAEPGDLVADLFAGTGNSARELVARGYNVLLCEMEHRWVEHAATAWEDRS